MINMHDKQYRNDGLQSYNGETVSIVTYKQK